MREKIYCGNAKIIQTQYGEMVKVTMSPKHIQALNDNVNERGWINLSITKNKEADKYGNTHSVVVDTGKPA